MATYYWVGGSGTWDQTATKNWAATSGGTGNAGAPTPEDDVVFDANSDTGGPFTVTIGGTTTTNTPFCKSFSTGGVGGALDRTMTLAGSGRLYLYGDMTLPAVNFVYSGITILTFQDSATLTTNGVTVGSVTIVNSVQAYNRSLIFNLGSALTCNAFSVNAGTINTNNFALTAVSLGSNTSLDRTINLGSSTVTLTGANAFVATTITSLTFNAGTSTIAYSNANPTVNSAGLTFYNVSFTSTSSGSVTINGSNTFNNLTYTSKIAVSFPSCAFESGKTQTINGTLTLGAANTAVIRMQVRASTYRSQTTLNVATMAALADVDFRDIVITGAAAPVSGTRIGNLLNNSGITFTAGVTKYWNLPAGGNWTDTAWALTSGGVPALNNYPLAQDTVVIEDTGLNSGATITFNLSNPVGNITTAIRTLPATIAFGTGAPGFYGNVTFSSAITLTGTGAALIGLGAIYGTTQTITSAGVTWPKGLSIAPVSGTTVFADALTVNGQVSCSLGSTPNVTGTVQFKNGVTHTATSFIFSAFNSSRITVASTVPGSTYTLSCSTGFVNAYFTTISDSVVTGGAIWTAALYYGNVNGGNNTGWNFPALSAINRGVPTSLSFGFRF
jgi:hypothetical protein